MEASTPPLGLPPYLCLNLYVTSRGDYGMQVFQIETFADGADCLSKSVTSGRRFGL